MACVPITFNGVFYPKGKSADDKPVAGTFVGNAWITGLAPDARPPEVPPGIWGGGNEPFPTPPIELPPPETPPEPPSMVKPPPDGGGWAWGPNVGWIFVPGTDTPGPKK